MGVSVNDIHSVQIKLSMNMSNTLCEVTFTVILEVTLLVAELSVFRILLEKESCSSSLLRGMFCIESDTSTVACKLVVLYSEALLHDSSIVTIDKTT